MAGEIQLNSVTLATESGGTISLSSDVDTLTPTKTALNASGSAPIYACRAWVNFRGTTQSGTATASGLVSGQYTATVTSASQFTVVYSGTTYTINTSGDHEIGDGEGVDLTVSGTTVTIDTQIRASGNVSSITDNGTGSYTVNFTTAMPDTNFAAVASCNYRTTAQTDQLTRTVSSVNVVCSIGGSGSTLVGHTDKEIVAVAIFR